jgi:Zn-dependent peptidase ImmA (M78 family)/transcriptional regulator with XRE-family HTH domain
MATAFAHINPDIVAWARDRAQLSTSKLAELIGTKEDKIIAWELGEKQPTFKQAKTIADKTYIPFGYLFLKEKPLEELPIPDLRTVDGKTLKKPSAELIKTIKTMLSRQDWFADYLKSQDIEENPTVGRFSIDSPVDVIVKDMREKLGVNLFPTRGKWDNYLTDLIKKIESLGIMVMRQGNMGHHTKPLLVEEFRGFAIFHKAAPVIFINTADAPKARLFTLIHELAHIWIGESGVSDAKPNTHRKEEILCNAVAAEFLVPEEELKKHWQELEDWRDNLAPLEANFRVSTWVLARRALTLDYITIGQYRQYIAFVKKQFEDEESSGIVPYYRVVSSQISNQFSKAIVSETLSGRVLLRDAGNLLNVKPNNVKKLARELRI